jgi:trk system potassium uptake protein TrkA
MKTSQKIMILGLGGVGRYLAIQLANEGHSITVIESDPEAIRRSEGEIDGRLIEGDAMNNSCWLEARASGMDYLIAVTDDDAVNILASMIGDRFGIPCKIARVRSRGLWSDGGVLAPEDLNIDFVIEPEELAAQEIVKLLKMRWGNSVFEVADGAMQVIGTRIGEASALLDLQIKEISRNLEGFDLRIVAIARDTTTLIPGGNDEVRLGDYVYCLVRAEDVPSLMLVVGMGATRRQRVMVVGGGHVGSRIAELLQGSFKLKLIEQDGRRAEELGQRLKDVELLHGDGADHNTLLTAGLLSMDTVITATGDNETNIMTSALAKQMIRNQPGERHGKEAKTVALVKREQYLTLAAAMGADVVLNRKVLAGDRILAFMSRGAMLSVARLYGVDAEVVELVAAPRSPITRYSLATIPGGKEFRGRMIIGCVFQDGEWRTAVGSTRVKAGDRVIAVCRPECLPDLERFVLR